MGIVYEAEQVSLRRRVALKVLSAVGGLDDRQLQRFRTEAQAAGALQHPHIAPVYAVGSEHGVHYYAMHFIDGPSLAGVIAVRRGQVGLSPGIPVGHYGLSSLPESGAGADGGPSTIYRPLDRLDEAVGGPLSSSNGSPSATTLPEGREFWRTAAQLGIEAAEALDHAHQQGIVHRDIKPANLLLDGTGRLWVVDFGLARLPTDAGLTMTGDLVGTLRYMSPEQALAKRAVVDHRTDVYSLGVTLYELLTLTPAFPGNDRQDVLRRIADEEPPAPRRLSPAIPADLETVVLKAMTKQATERYATAQELADDLRRWLEDKPIVARRPTRVQRAQRWARRHQRLVASVAAAAVVLVVGLVLGYAFQQREARNKVEAALGRERASRHDELLAGARTARGERLPGYRDVVWDNLHKALALEVPGKDREAIAAEVLACLGDPIGLPIVDRPDDRRAFPPPAPVEQNGMRRVKAPGGGAWADYQNDIVWPSANDTERRPPVRSFLGNINQLRFNGDGSLLAAACDEGFVVWDAYKMGVRLRVGGGRVFALALHPQGHVLATAGSKVEVWSLDTSRLVASLPMPRPAPEEIEFSADGRLLMGFVGGAAVIGWAVRDTPEKRRLDGHRQHVPAIAFSPDGRMLASVSRDQEVKIWDTDTGRLLHTCKKHSAPIESVAFSPCGLLVVTGDLNGVVYVWNAATGAFLTQLPGSGPKLGEVWRIQFDAAMTCLAAAGRNAVAAWAIRFRNDGLAFEPVVNLPTAGVYDLALRPDGSALAFLAQPKPDQPARLYRYDLAVKEAAKPLDVPVRHRFRALNFDSSGKVLTYATPDGRLGRWDWEKGVALSAIDAGQKLYQTALAPDGRFAATGGPDRSVAVYELETGKRVLALPPEESDIQGLAWGPDGRRVAASLSDGGIVLWDMEEVRARLAEFDIELPWKPPAKK
jgi:serine/threonine protein kinase/WD40 repeat protein